MGLYSRYVLPHLVDLACGQRPIMRQREKTVPLATGRVLEIGFGSGRNLPYYSEGYVTHLWALEPSEEMWDRAADAVLASTLRVEWLQADAEKVPLPADSADSVVATFTLCSIPNLPRAMSEIRRVLRPGGELFFSEHGLAPDESVRRWQTRLTPVWKHVAGGCHLDRDIPRAIRDAGFTIEPLQTMYLPGWRPGSFAYWGTAT